MPVDTRELLVFVASPSDASDEREAVRRAAANLNVALGTVLGLRLRVTGWEDVAPELGRPQAQINPLVSDCDIFIGVLKRRWGTATGTHTSGFEEEFAAAVDRRVHGEAPAIALYFKRLPTDLVDDPGPELLKVLAFRQRLRKEHEALYHEYETTSDLELAVMKYLSSVLARAAELAAPRSPEGTVNSVASHPSPSAGVTVDIARQELAAVLRAFERLVGGEGPVEFLDRDRLLLFSQAIHSDADLLPTHPGNRLYQRRRELHLSSGEYDYWLRSLVSDIARSVGTGWDRGLPGWFLLAPAPPWQLEAFAIDLVGLIADDDDDMVARGAFLLLTQLRARPPALWERSSGLTSELDAERSAEPHASATRRWASALSHAGRRDEGLKYLLTASTPEDSALLEEIADELGEDGGEEVLAIKRHLGGDNTTLALSVAGSYSARPWAEHEVFARLSDLPTDSLRRLVTGSHGSTKVRAAATEALLQRRAVDVSTLARALRTEQLHDMIFTAASSPGGTVSSTILFEALGTMEDGPRKRELLTRATGSTTPMDELRVIMQNPLAAVDAWEAMSWSGHAADLAEEARNVLDTDAEQFIASLLFPKELDTDNVVDWYRARARRAAFRILSDVSMSARDDSDVRRARAEVARDHWFTNEPAIRYLAVVGETEDIPILLSSLEQWYGTGARDDLRAGALRIGGLAVARALVQGEDADNALAGVGALLSASANEVPDPELVELLYDERAPVRTMALEGLKSRWEREQLEELLNSYPRRSDGYYYNVVAELDRLLYAPAGIGAVNGA